MDNNYRSIQGNNQKNLTGYSQQNNNILGKTINNQNPNMINNPFFNEMLTNNDNSNINLNNMNINSMNNMNIINQNDMNMNINQNQNQTKSLSYLNHKNMKINQIFPNSMAIKNDININPCDSSSKQESNKIAYTQKPNEKKNDISKKMENLMNNNNNNFGLNMNDSHNANNANNNMNVNNSLNNMKNNISNINNNISNMNNNMNNNSNLFNNNNKKNPQNNINNPNQNMNPQKNISKEEEKEYLDECKKTVFENSRFIDYKESETTQQLNNLLKRMDNYGEINKKKIEQEKIATPNKFISLNEALSSNFQDEHKRKDYYVLSLLKFALESQGCSCEIEKDYATENEKIEFYSVMQYITNGMYKLKKYIFTFDFGTEKNTTMLKNITTQSSFNDQLKTKLTKLLKIDSATKNIIMSKPRNDPYNQCNNKTI